MLLKLKSTQYIPSSEDENKPIPGVERLKKRKNVILDRYIDFMQRKTLGKQDHKLLETLGFGQTLKLLIDDQKEEERKEAALSTAQGRRFFWC